MQKLLTVLLCAMFVCTSVYAQKWVSTNVEKRKVILEEFTGIHCGWCPDGHRIATALHKAYPEDIFLVNIHSGDYAEPSTGEVDLRTDAGTEILAASGVTSFPSGSINRDANPWGIDRGYWESAALAVMSEDSPVNVAVKSSVNFATRVLTTEVEIYYTSNSDASTNYLTVYLSQSNILGTQSGGTDLFPENYTRDGKYYRHNHALRQVITSDGYFGETIDTTTAGHYEYRKYVTTLPESINDIKMALNYLEVVAFVCESQDKILSGAGTEVEYPVADRIDLGIVDKTTYRNDLKAVNFTPVAEITNYSGIEITSFVANLLYNSKTYPVTFTGSLKTGEKTTLSWDEIVLTKGGSYSVDMYGFTNINNDATIVDMYYFNDESITSKVGFIEKAVKASTFGFNSTTLPANSIFDQTKNAAFSIYRKTTKPYAGANNTLGTIRFPLHSSWGLAGLPGYIMFGEVDVPSLPFKNLQYQYAYSDGQFGGTAPKIKVEASTDWGVNWTEISNITCQQTKDSLMENWYVPIPEEYIKVDVDLTQYASTPILVRIAGIAGSHGNAMYIDEVIFGSDPTDVEEAIVGENSTTLYPNPATVEVRFNNELLLGKQYEIYSSLGELVAKGLNNSNSINIAKFTTGIYTIRINNQTFRFVKN